MVTRLLLDVNYLAYRAYHAMGGLQYKGEPTGVTFGILRDVRKLMAEFQTDQIVFCFDYGKNKRIEMYNGYKLKRRKNKENLPEMIERRKQMDQELDFIRTQLLPRIGFQNIVFQKGYEADDLIASICQKEDDHFNVIVSGDEDLYQLLNKRNIVWNPRLGKSITRADFHNIYGISPRQWAKVKAVGGCHSDQIPGLKGVGEATAVQFVKGVANAATTSRIKEFMQTKEYALYLRLVKIPLDGLEEIKLEVQKPIAMKTWKKELTRIGMFSLIRS